MKRRTPHGDDLPDRWRGLRPLPVASGARPGLPPITDDEEDDDDLLGYGHGDDDEGPGGDDPD
jgi:hypothetical protein